MNFFTPKIKSATFLFIVLNVFLYLFLYLFNNKINFNYFNYTRNATIYIHDSRIDFKGFNLFNNLAQYDAQWYLRIAQKGYPTNPTSKRLEVMDGATYAFFPLYPMTLRALNFFFPNILLTAFLFANALLMLNFWSLIFVIKEFVSEKMAIRTSFLLFLFPFSIFYRSYFTEGLFVFFLIWFSHFFVKKKYTYSSFLLGLSSITRGSGVLLYFPYFYYLIKGYRKGTVTIFEVIKSLVLSIFPIILWVAYAFHKTHDILYFMKIRSAWNGDNGIIGQLIMNINKTLSFSSQALHSFHSSKIDIIVIAATLILLLLSYKKLNNKLWLISFCLFLAPLIFNDTISYSRMQIVSFPLFLFIASRLSGKHYFSLALIFGLGLMIVSLLFINWYWIG